MISYLHSKNIQTILLSGDSAERTQKIAETLGIDKVFAEKTPEEKLQIIEQLNNEAPVAMVGDGINDAPALAKATIGISMSDATQLAVQSAQVVLMNKGIQHLPLALGLGKHTFYHHKGKFVLGIYLQYCRHTHCSSWFTATGPCRTGHGFQRCGAGNKFNMA